MIIRNFTELPGGSILAHLYIQVGRAQMSKAEVFSHKTPAAAAMQRWITAWLKAEITRFINQREKAYQAVMDKSHQWMIDAIRQKVLVQPHYTSLCQCICSFSEILRNLLPSSNSPQYGWTPIIDYIINHAHQITNAQHQRSVPRPIAQP